MDRRNILVIFAVAWLSAALLTWFVYSRMTASAAEKTETVVAAARDLSAGTRLRKNDLKRVKVSEKNVPKGAVMEERAAVDRVLLYPVSANETIVSSRLTTTATTEGIASMIEPGKRAISVPITDVSSAGGLIGPRAHVDVLFTRTGSLQEALTTTILQDVIVLSIGKMTEAGQNLDPRLPKPQQQTATLLVYPEQARLLELARNNGKISLALRNPLDRNLAEDGGIATAAALAPGYRGAAIRSGAAARPPIPNVRDDRVWNGLVGGTPPAPDKPKEEKREPPKPKYVIDVYRGDKHVQEIFQ
ncbi:MAG TPA: Flp pilus assembly protein CpaB [Bryobacteraceae bacterium]|nr:Flp pilus assembly protein CpaB [Bryobacteraceae bacterium]